MTLGVKEVRFGGCFGMAGVWAMATRQTDMVKIEKTRRNKVLPASLHISMEYGQVVDDGSPKELAR